MTGAAVFLAFTSALCFGVALVLTHIGLRYIAPLPGAAISTAAPDVPTDDLAAAHRVRAAAAPDAFLRVQEKNKLLRAEYAVADFIVACVVDPYQRLSMHACIAATSFLLALARKRSSMPP